ncbi:MAG: LamG domain-containing protein [Planctomycetaceae bacterium]|nr:LamG domain-containing protein [Planctomycetaceae bacterium]
MNGFMECPMAPPGGWGSQKPPAGVPIDASHPLANGLVGFLALNEGAGTTAADATGLRAPAKMYPTASPPTWNGAALRFDGSAHSRYVALSNAGWPKLVGAFAMTVKIRPTEWSASSHEGVYGGNGLGTGDGFAMTRSYSTDEIWFDQYSAADVRTYTRISASYVPAKTWTTVTYQWSGPGNRANAWVNGIQRGVSYTMIGGIPTDVGWGTAPLTLGASRLSYYYFNGDIEFAALHNRALSDDEIRRLHADPYSLFASAPSSAFDVSNRRRRLLCGAA